MYLKYDLPKKYILDHIYSLHCLTFFYIFDIRTPDHNKFPVPVGVGAGKEENHKYF